jgi:solute carrier family 25 citrate transporter 1
MSAVTKEELSCVRKKEHTSLYSLIGKPILAGAMTGAIESFVTYPTEYVKTHLQLQSKVRPRYSGIADCFGKTIQEHGVFGLYRGMTPILVGSIPKQASRWGAYESATAGIIRMKTSLLGTVDKKKPLTLAEVSFCGFLAGSFEAIVAVVPTETIKTKLIDDSKLPHPKYQRLGFVRAVSLMLREEGYRGIYRGVSNTVTKQGLNQSVRFPAQLTCMGFFCKGNSHRQKSPFWNGLAGFGAGCFSVIITQPFDVVKTKMQGAQAQYFVSSWDCWQSIARHEGVKHFYSGSMARMLRVGGNVALTFTIFPLLKEML